MSAIETYKNDDIALIKTTVMPPQSTDSELRLFLATCVRTGLDPLARQIYALKIGGKLSIQTSIDGLRLIAERTDKYAGQRGPWWCGPDEQWREIWLSDEPPAAAKVEVYKLGSDIPTTGVATWAQYSQTSSPMWKKMPALMLAKCAESLALRKAFPNDLSGLYTREEMSQAATPEHVDSETGEVRQLTVSRPAPRFDDDHPAVMAAQVVEESAEIVEDETVTPIRSRGDATEKQLNAIRKMMAKLGENEDEFDLEALTKAQASKAIEELGERLDALND